MKMVQDPSIWPLAANSETADGGGSVQTARASAFLVNPSMANPSDPCIVALAGRRIDPSGQTPGRFPQASAPAVRAAIVERLVALRPSGLVCSAACGADLLALEAASNAGIPCRIVLPFSAGRFRKTSVTDRAEPDYWGALYDRLVAQAAGQGNLIELEGARPDDEAFARANDTIVREAQTWAARNAPSGRTRLVALLVWDGLARASGDATDQFGKLAAAAGFDCETILTI